METTFGEYLRELRKQCGLTQLDLAYAIGYTQQAVNKWEGNHSLPGYNAIRALSRALGVPPGELCNERFLEGV